MRGWDEIIAGSFRCVTSNLVVAEAATLLTRLMGGARAAEKVQTWYESEVITVLRSDERDELLATSFLSRYADQRIGFVDCVSFALMQRMGIRSVFGFDRHFAIAGFRLWPEVKR